MIAYSFANHYDGWDGLSSKELNSKVDAVDISEDALIVAKKNNERKERLNEYVIQ